jgi:hypothetical protein
MDPSDIELHSIDSLFEYEKHSRVIDKLDADESKLFAKLYYRLYLKQQETLRSLGSI